MSLIMTDGFDHYSITQVSNGQKWDQMGAINNLGPTYARSGGQGARLQSPGNCFVKNLVNQVTYIVGTAWNFQTLSGVAGTLYTFFDGTTAQVSIRLNADLTVSILVGGTAVATSSARASLNQWHYWEVLATINASTGVVTVRLDGQVFLTFTGNTLVSSTAQINQLLIYSGPSVGSQVWVDDIYICDTNGSTNNTFLGDVKITAVVMNTNGSFSQFTPTGAGTNVGCINQPAPDDDTTYISDSTAGDIDTWHPTSLSLTGQIFGAVMWLRARKDDAGVRSIAAVARSNSINSFGTTYTLGSTYTYYGTVYETDPNTGLPWTLTGLNNAEWGVKVIS